MMCKTDRHACSPVTTRMAQITHAFVRTSQTTHPLTSLCRWRNFAAWPLAKSISSHLEEEYQVS
jgi:hypothetical protein